MSEPIAETTASPAPISSLPQQAEEATHSVLPMIWQLIKNKIKRPFYTLYLRRLRAKAATWRKPRHLGIIMDGNRRFARQLGFDTAVHGHRKGAEKLQEVLSWCLDYDIDVVTVWSFSLENFQRSTEEVEGLLGLFEDKAREMADSEEIHRRRVRVRFIGRIELLPESLRHEIERLERLTADYDQGTLNIAMAYGGREEIADAFRRHVKARLAENAPVEQILAELDSDSITPHLYTSGQPEPELILRTSGELRLSGFLLWQSAYSEFYFCDTNWPAFREIDFLRALRSFDERQRRFGR